MMISCVPYCLLVLLLMTSPAASAQAMNDLGMMGESGVVFTPTTGITPVSHFRLDLTRVNFLRSGAERLNSIGLSTGLSTNMEFTVKFQTLEPGTSLTPSVIGFGGKFALPFGLPLISQSAIWAEFISSGSVNFFSIIPSSINRGAFVFQPLLLRNINGHLILGLTGIDNTQRFLVGSNGSYIINGLLKVGGEIQYNYYGNSDVQGSMLILLRAHPNVCVQLSPGYLRSPGVSSWMFSLGVSVSSTSIYFVMPEQPKQKGNEIPSIDELEKQIREEKKEN